MMCNSQISVKKNFFYNTVFQVLILFVPFITTPYVSRVLGAANVGKYSYASAMVTYFTLLAALGSTVYGQRKIAYYRGNKQDLSRVFWNTFAFRCVMGLLALGLYALYVFLFEGYNLINLIISISIVNVAFDISWFFQGIEDFKDIVIRNLIVRMICLSGIFIFVKTSSDTWIYVLILMCAQWAGSLSMWILMPKYIGLPDIINPFDDFKNILLIFLPSIAIQVYTVLDKSMIGWITGSDYANGCYEQSERIVRLAITVVTSVGTVVLPRVANLFHSDNLSQAKRYVYLSFRVVWMIAIPMMFGLMSVSSVFIPLFLGSGFEDSVLLLSIFSVLIVVVSLAYIVGLSYLIPTKQQNVYTAAVSVAAGVNFCLNLILIRRYGAFGAAISSVIAEAIGTAIQIIYCVYHKQLVLSQIFIPAWKYALAATIMFGIVLALKQIFVSGLFALLALVSLGILIYAFILFVLKDSFFMENITKLINRFLRKLEA